MLLVSSRSLHLRLLQDKATWLKIKQVSCPCTCPRLLLGHHQTHGPCKTTQSGSRSNSVGVLARVLLVASHYTRGSCKTRQCSKGSDNFRVLAQVPPVASWSPPHLQVLQSNTTLLKVKLHWCPCTRAAACFSVTAFGAPGRQQNIAQTQSKLVSLHGHFWLLLGHHTRGSCKTRQHGSRSNKFSVLAWVPLVVWLATHEYKYENAMAVVATHFSHRAKRHWTSQAAVSTR